MRQRQERVPTAAMASANPLTERVFFCHLLHSVYFQRYIFYGLNQRLRDRARPTNGSDRGSLRDHDLTLFVRRHCLLAATGGRFGTTRTFCFVTVPFPPIQTADEFFNTETELRHV